MAIYYSSLTEEQKNFHITGMVSSGYINGEFVVFPVSGILPSGEGNFYDMEQIPQNRDFIGHNQYKMSFLRGSEPLDNLLPLLPPSSQPFKIPIIATSGLREYASGDVTISYIHNSPNPSGGTGELDKTPYQVSFGFEPIFNSG